MSSSASFISSRVMASRALKGSSISRMSGSFSNARQIATRWRMPPLSSCGRFFSKPCRPTMSTNCCARSRYSASGLPRTCAGNITFCSTVFHGSKVGSWNMMPMLGRGPVIGRPAISIVPPVARSSPPHIMSNVLLPQPLGPRMAMNSPLATSKLTSLSASTGLSPEV